MRIVVLEFEDDDKYTKNVIHTIVANGCIPNVGAEPACRVVGHYDTFLTCGDAMHVLAQEEA
jgi:hypothetical protein